jgi:hypothetical protein
MRASDSLGPMNHGREFRGTISHRIQDQINTRVWLTEFSRTLGRAATLDDIPDAELDRLAKAGFDWLWFLSVWQTGPAGQLGHARQPRLHVPVRIHRRDQQGCAGTEGA